MSPGVLGLVLEKSLNFKMVSGCACSLWAKRGHGEFSRLGCSVSEHIQHVLLSHIWVESTAGQKIGPAFLHSISEHTGEALERDWTNRRPLLEEFGLEVEMERDPGVEKGKLM